MTTAKTSAEVPQRALGLDGLRGLAVLMVVASHLSSYHAEQAGPAGVAIFFTLSGYLITSLLLQEESRWGRVDSRAFYARRALRLFPGLLLIVLLTPPLLWAVSDPRLDTVWPGLATTLFYIQDFASATGHFSVLAHAWSLAVEEQFYMIWPFVLGLILFRFRENYRMVERILFGLCVLGFVWHIVSIFRFGYDWTYYSPDSNAIFLLSGCALAAARHSGRRLVVPRPVAMATLIMVCVLPLVITRVVAVDEWQLQALLMFPVDLAGGVLVLAASRLSILKLPLLRWFGRISYGLYLWNWLLISLEPGGQILSGSQRLVSGLLAIVAAAGSWYLVESPILRFKKRYHRGDLAPEGVARANTRRARRTRPAHRAYPARTAHRAHTARTARRVHPVRQEFFDNVSPTILPRFAESSAEQPAGPTSWPYPPAVAIHPSSTLAGEEPAHRMGRIFPDNARSLGVWARVDG